MVRVRPDEFILTPAFGNGGPSRRPGFRRGRRLGADPLGWAIRWR